MEKKGSIYYSVAFIMTMMLIDKKSFFCITFIPHLLKYKIKTFT